MPVSFLGQGGPVLRPPDMIFYRVSVSIERAVGTLIARSSRIGLN